MTRKALSGENSTDSKFVCNQNGLLLAAVHAGSVQQIRKLLDECENLKSQVVNAPCGLMKITALQLAASKGKQADELVKVLLEYGAKADSSDKVGRTPLHNAALVGNAEAVETLLRAGANVDACFQVNSWPRQANYLVVTDAECNEFSTEFKLPVPECWGRTPLHQAVKGGNPECVRLLLEAKANVNAEDEKGVTPLLLAGTGIFPGNKKEVNRYEEVVELLVKAGADVNAYSEFAGLTAMHHAAELRSLRAMKCLLDHKAEIPDMNNKGVRTVLHEAAHTGNIAMLELLLERGANKLVNSTDTRGHTPLHKAAYAGSRECLAMLLKHGGDLAVMSAEGVSVMDTIYSHIPRPVNFITDTLDRHVIPNNADINTREFKVTLDFHVLCPRGAERQMEVVTALLRGGTDLQQRQIVRHPLLETFLRFKWYRLRVFFYMLMAVHFGLVLSLSTFCSLRIHKDDVDSNLLAASHKALFITVTVLGIHFIIQVVMLPQHYVTQYETWINLLSIVLSYTIAIGHVTGRMQPFLKDGVPTEHAWVLHIMSFAVLLVWIEFMLLIGRIPTWGYYALMFYQVLRNVVKVLLTFSGLVIGFTLSFQVQFHDSGEFKTVWHSLVKTIVMMMGEYEYNSLFGEDSDKKRLRLIGTSRVIFFMFVVLASIVLMNLMVGLAVSDIQELQVEGHTQRILKQAEFVTHLENLTMHHLIPQWLHRLLAVRRCIDTKFEIQPSEFKSLNNNLSYHLLERIIGVAISNQRRMNNTIYTKKSGSDPDVFSSKGTEYGSMSDEPASSVDNMSVVAMLHQLHMEIAEIKSALSIGHTSARSSMSHEEAGSPDRNSVRMNRWARPVTDIQDAQGILRRLRRTSKTQTSLV